VEALEGREDTGDIPMLFQWKEDGSHM